jgi:putative ABC transport system permease protein
MRIPLLRGRLFSEQDAASNPKVAIISETLARRYFPRQDPIGHQMKFGFPPNTGVAREIVGVVGDVRNASLSRAPGPIMYVPFEQEPLWGAEVVVRSSLDQSSVAAAVRHAVDGIDKNLPVTDIEAMADAVGQSIAQERFRTFLLSAFSAIALLLAAVGIFGVVSYFASQRTHEIGVRIALGAQQSHVLRLILGEAARLALIGIVIGTAAAFGLTRLMNGLLYGISANDPVSFGSTAVILLFVALTACYVPARRAARLHPVEALRYE